MDMCMPKPGEYTSPPTHWLEVLRSIKAFVLLANRKNRFEIHGIAVEICVDGGLNVELCSPQRMMVFATEVFSVYIPLRLDISKKIL